MFQLEWGDMLSHLNKWLWQLNLILCCLFGWVTSYAEQPIVREYQVKAAYLFKFGKFTTYPANVFSSANASFNICVLGEDPFQRTLDTAIKDEQIQDHPVTLHYFQTLEEVRDCHTLFISESEQRRLADILAYVRQRSILTVSDIKNFVSQGGMIEFFLEGNNVRFFIDPSKTNEAGLQMNSQLLRLAIIKNGKPLKE